MGVIIDASFVITEKNYHEIAEFARKVKRFGAGDNAKYRIDFMDSSVSEKHGKEIHELLAEAEEEKKEEKDGKFGVVSIHSEDEIKNPCREILSSRCCGFKCFTCGLWACVAADGSVYPCGHIVSGDVKTYGNILFQEIEEIWESEKRKMLIGNLPIDKCWICSPFSLNTNKLGTFLVEWAREREISPEGLVAELHDEYTGRKEAAA
jgi:radical SAM protein with 4Fe4S-binding SPASM domain